MKKKWIWKTILIVFIAIIALFYHKRNRGPRFDRVVLIIVDTLWADHLGCYGYPRKTSPFMDQLAKQGIHFNHAVAAMATTAPAITTIFTSLYPLQHNVIRNSHKLDSSHQTLAEILSGMGYQTLGFVSVYFRGRNIHQGFKIFDEPRDLGGAKYRVAKKTIDSLIHWFDRNAFPEKFFLWIHLYDPHHPLHPPDAFLKKHSTGTGDAKAAFKNFLLDRQHVDFDFFNNDTEKMFNVIDAYDGEISYVDAEIQRVFNFLKKKGLGSRTLWIITADHGEGLGNHRWLEHGKRIYNEQVRVPLLFYSPNLPGGKVINAVTEHVDILPTVLDMVNKNKKNLSSSKFQGVSLFPLMSTGQVAFPSKYAFSQRKSYRDIPRPEVINPDETDYEDGNKYALQNQFYKYIYWTAGKDELYDLKDDPYETRNRINDLRDVAEDFKNRIKMKIKTLKETGLHKPSSVDDKTFKELKSLGYL